MKNAAITDPIFREAVEAIDAGNESLLRHLLNTHSWLTAKRLDFPEEGYFSHPYLLWFVADNPIRHEKLPSNIAAITHLLLQHTREKAAASFQEQINYTLGLVVTGRIPRECGVQIELMDTLIDAGAEPGTGHGALAHGNTAAARHLIERGSAVTLADAVCLDYKEEAVRLAKKAGSADRELALVAAAFYGKADMIRFLIELGVDVNAYPDGSGGFHSHATALHQAVYAGSRDAVELLVKAGANLQAKDRIYQGTPLGWATHLQAEEKDEIKKGQYTVIETFLLGRENGKN